MINKEMIMNVVSAILIVLGIFMTFFVDKVIPADASHEMLMNLRERHVLVGVVMIGAGYYMYMSQMQAPSPAKLV